MTTAQILVAAGLTGIAGLVRGVTGFGGAMVLTAPLSMIVGAKQAVVTVLALEGLAAFPMLPDAFRRMCARVILPICMAAALAMPVGSHYLATYDATVVRRSIGGVVLVFSLLMMSGYRYAGSQRLGTSVGIGALAGMLVGATGIGGPPIIAYLLAGPDRAAITRANLTIILVGISLAALAAAWWSGVMREVDPTLALWLALPYIGGIGAGTRLFRRVNEHLFRRLALALIAAIGLVALLA